MTRSDATDAAQAARIIATAFARYIDRFRYLTHLARGGFERGDWQDTYRIAALRLDIYGDQVADTLAGLQQRMGARLTAHSLWADIRAVYTEQVRERGDVELAETFFNSIVRRVFHTIGVDPGVEFVAPAHEPERHGPPWSMTVRFERSGVLDIMVRAALESYRFDTRWDDLEGDVQRIAGVLRDEVGEDAIAALELHRSPFFRGKGAYLVGHLHTDGAPHPIVIAITNPEGRLVVDAVLPSENEVSIVFSFSRSYFLVEMDRPRELVDFLRAILPQKPLADLYNAVGFHRHGKTELYRTLLLHLEASDDLFEIAPGQRGMVMTVFTLPGFDMVFKVLRDRFQYPKTVTHEEVRAKYTMVFRTDRGGRLVDAQEFEHLEFDRARFSEALLEELLSSAAETVIVRGDRVEIRHLYVERRLHPLDMYLKVADLEAAREAVLDYGQAMRDLASTNIFPGDMLLKNFGVSRHGRLIFYDYDELCRITDLNFRVLPKPRNSEDETAGEPWFYVGEHDIFPEEFRAFLGLKKELLDVFLATHGELLDVQYWHRMQELHRNGERLDVYPYKKARRLRLRQRARESGRGELRRGGGDP